MTSLLTLFEQLIEKAGLSLTDAAIVEFLKKPELTMQIPDEVSNPINKNLIGLEDAKNNHPVIKSHYFAEVMANVDRALQKVYQKLELDEDLITELAKETSSTKRIALLGDKLDVLMKAKAAESGKGTGAAATALQKQIDDLNNALRVEKEARVAEKTQFEGSLRNYKIETILTGKVVGLKTVYDTLPSEVRATTLKTLLNKELQDSEVQMTIDDNGNMKLLKKDGSNYYDENNRLVTPDDFIQRTLAKNKVLAQSTPTKTGGGSEQPSGNGATHVAAPVQKGKIDTTELFNESMKAFDNPNPVSVATGQ